MSPLVQPKDAFLAEDFDRDGFVDCGLLLTPYDLDTLRTEMERFADVQIRGAELSGPMPRFQEVGLDGSHFNMMDLWKCSPPYEELVRNERLMDMAANLLNVPSVKLWADLVQYKPARNGGAFGWHQDGWYHMHIGGIQAVERVVTAWIALDDADEESGCMWMVPGSHRWGDRDIYLRDFSHLRGREELKDVRPQTEQEIAEWRDPVACPVKAGAVHFHHAHTWHGSPINNSTRPRRGYTVFYMADDVEVPA